jgi:hypothetical protein
VAIRKVEGASGHGCGCGVVNGQGRSIKVQDQGCGGRWGIITADRGNDILLMILTD